MNDDQNKWRLLKWPEGKDIRISIKDPQSETFRMEAIPKQLDCPLCKSEPNVIDIESGHKYIGLDYGDAELKAYFNAIKLVGPQHNPRKNNGKVSYHKRIQKKWNRRPPAAMTPVTTELVQLVFPYSLMKAIKDFDASFKAHKPKLGLRQKVLWYRLPKRTISVSYW
jgi:hypothetical protein